MTEFGRHWLLEVVLDGLGRRPPVGHSEETGVVVQNATTFRLPKVRTHARNDPWPRELPFFYNACLSPICNQSRWLSLASLDCLPLDDDAFAASSFLGICSPSSLSSNRHGGVKQKCLIFDPFYGLLIRNKVRAVMAKLPSL